MTSEELKTKIFGKTETGERYTFRQWLIFVWFALSLFLLCAAADDASITVLLVYSPTSPLPPITLTNFRFPKTRKNT